MENFFLTQYFDWSPPPTPRAFQLVNGAFRRLGWKVRVSPPNATGAMTNIEQRVNLYHLVSQVLAYKVPGAVVELGCHEGHSSVLIQKVIDHYDPSREFHVYDSFAGLEPPTEEDENPFLTAGELAVSEARLIENFRKYGLRCPQIHKGWFKDTLPTQLPSKIAFAYLDGDFYDAIKVSLEYVYPKLPPGAVCVIDDYADPAVHNGWNRLPGVKKACDEFFVDKPEEVAVLYSGHFSHGFFRKL